MRGKMGKIEKTVHGCLAYMFCKTLLKLRVQYLITAKQKMQPIN